MNKFIKMSVLLSSVIITNDILHAQPRSATTVVEEFIQTGQIADDVIVFGQNKYGIEFDGKALKGEDLKKAFQSLKKTKKITSPQQGGGTSNVPNFTFLDVTGKTYKVKPAK